MKKIDLSGDLFLESDGKGIIISKNREGKFSYLKIKETQLKNLISALEKLNFLKKT